MNINIQTPVYTKEVNEHEFLITSIASRVGICPKLISWKCVDDEYTINLEKYPKTLSDVTGWSNYKKKAVELLNKLHSLEIVHCDIYEHNIVVNPDTNDVKLIDFGLSEWYNDIKGENINYYGTSISVEELFKEEMDVLVWLFDHGK